MDALEQREKSMELKQSREREQESEVGSARLEQAGSKMGIVCFDMDGTLLDNSIDVIPESAQLAVDRLRKRHYIVISTGRDMDAHYSMKYRDIIRPDAVIHLNGTKITAGGKTILEHYMDEAFLKRLFRYAEAHDYCFGTTIGTEDYYTAPHKKVEADRVYNRFIKRNFRPVSELLESGKRVRALSYAGELAREKEALGKAFPELKLIGFASGYGADVVEQGFSKAEGLKRLCSYYGIAREHTAAFGDSLNDMEIVQYAGIGIAMGNAVDELKAVADYVTDDVKHDGILHACEKLGLF